MTASPRPAEETRTCVRPGCGETFVCWRSARQRYHNAACAMQARYEAQFGPKPSREARTRTCPGCGQPFVVPTITAKQRYCGVGCGQRGGRRKVAAL